MVSEALKELGRRLARRRSEAGLSTAELANLASVHEVAIQAYEEGRGELGASVLIRVADALGIKSGELLSTNAPESRAPIEPTVLLRTGFTASLNSADRAIVANALRRARAFREIGALLRVQSLVDAFEPTDVPSGRPAHYAGERLAATVRQQLPSRPGPLRNIQRLIEETFNILVTTYRFANSGVQGAACRAGSARVIVINSALRYEAMRRTVLAHELAHHLADLDAGSALMDEHGEDALTFYSESAVGAARQRVCCFVLGASGCCQRRIRSATLRREYERKGKKARRRSKAQIWLGSGGYDLASV